MFTNRKLLFRHKSDEIEVKTNNSFVITREEKTVNERVFSLPAPLYN